MNPDELIKKAKDLLTEGNIEKAQKLVEDHKDDLGDYYAKAKELLSSDQVDGLLDKFKKLF